MRGRNRDAYWEARRRRAAQPRPDGRAAAIAAWKAKKDAERAAALAAQPAPQTQRRWTDTIQPHYQHATIKGERGPCHIERVVTRVPGGPSADLRILVRWEGKLRYGARIHAGAVVLEDLRWLDQPCKVLAFTPMGPGDDAAVIVCKKLPLPKPKKKRRPTARRRTR